MKTLVGFHQGKCPVGGLLTLWNLRWFVDSSTGHGSPAAATRQYAGIELLARHANYLHRPAFCLNLTKISIWLTGAAPGHTPLAGYRTRTSSGPAARTKQSWTVLRGDFQIQISHCKLVNCFLWPILEVHILISIKGTKNVFIRIYCFSYISCPVWKIRFHYSSLITFRRNYCNLAWNKNWFKIEVTLPIMILVKSRNFH